MSTLWQRTPDLRERPQMGNNLERILALGGILFVGNVEYGEACVVFAFTKAGSGAPVTALSLGVVAVGVTVELSVIRGNDPSTSVGGS